MFTKTIAKLKNQRPNDRSDFSRHYAILITDLEKLQAYYAHYLAGGKELLEEPIKATPPPGLKERIGESPWPKEPKTRASDR